jgi:hypothetical protein
MLRNCTSLTFALLLAHCLSWSGIAHAGSAENPVEEVYVSLALLDVDAISSADQSFTVNILVQFRWFDPALAHDGESNIRRNLQEIAAPRFLLVNRQKTWSSLLNVVDIAPDGTAIYRMRLWGDFSQPLALHDFPFDSHRFSIPVLALSHEGGPVRLVPDPESDSLIASQLSVADWQVTGWSGESDIIELTPEDKAQGFIFSFQAKRIYNHYVIKFIIPLVLIVMMSWIVFWIDPEESGSQLSVAVTAALTLIAYHIALAGKLPDIPYLTRMDMFLFGSTLLVFSAMLEVVLTSRMARSGHLDGARRLDRWCRALFPLLYLAIAYWSLFRATST